MRILLIEDHLPCVEGFLCLMEEYLPEAEVTYCTTLQGAIDALGYEAAFDVIVLDLSLPDATGTEGLERLRELLRETVTTPIVVYTAYPQFQHACLDLGAGAFCVKATINGHDLADTVRRVALGRGDTADGA